MVAKTENGWGSVFNEGITGGAGGEELEFTDFVDMWLWMLANPTTAAIVTYTGPDFSRIGFPLVATNSTFSNSIRFQITGLKNKTIRASAGQTLTFCNIRFPACENIIWENWSHFDSLDDLTACLDGSINIWIRHCTLDGAEFDTDGTVDGACDITLRSNYIAVTDCLFINCNKTSLVSSSNVSISDRGLLKVTYTRNKFINCVQRKPSTRFGNIGFHFNTVDDSGLVALYGSSRCVQVAAECRIFSYRNNYQAGRWLFMDRFGIDSDIDSTNWGALKSVEDVVGPSWIVGLTEIRPELVEDANWDPRTEPNYTLETWTAAEAEAYVDQWAGATMHLMGETPTTYTLTLTTTAGGTATRDPESGDIEQNATVILTATPSTGFNFSRWENLLTGQTLSTSTTYNHVMLADISIVAVFVSDVPVEPGDVIRFCRIDEPIV